MLRTTVLATLLSLCSLAAAAPSPVVGGSPAKPGAWPDVVAVLTADGGLCSGTLIGSDLVLTAAHCTDAKPVEVIIGSVDLAQYGGERRDVKWSRSYPNWQVEYDVGIVMLENPVATKPRAIASGCALAGGDTLQVVGFGLTTKSGTGDNTKLHQAKLPVTDPDCTQDPACAVDIAPDGEFVAGGQGTDACFGDSGGPVYIKTKTGPAVIGVVSRGLLASPTPCGDGGVFVRADKVVKWIEKTSGRKLARLACDGPADAPATVNDGGGCNASGGRAGLAVGLGLLVMLWLVSSLRTVRIGD
jgi:secreted trypsin-like serine protease